MYKQQLGYISQYTFKVINLYLDMIDSGALVNPAPRDPIAIMRYNGDVSLRSIHLVSYGEYRTLFDVDSEDYVRFLAYVKENNGVDEKLVDIRGVPCQFGRPWIHHLVIEDGILRSSYLSKPYNVCRNAYSLDEVTKLGTHSRFYPAKDIFSGTKRRKAAAGPISGAMFKFTFLPDGEVMVEYVPGDDYLKVSVLLRSFAWIFKTPSFRRPNNAKRFFEFRSSDGYIGLKPSLIKEAQWSIAAPIPSGIAMSDDGRLTPIVCSAPRFRTIKRGGLACTHSFLFIESEGRLVYQDNGNESIAEFREYC